MDSLTIIQRCGVPTCNAVFQSTSEMTVAGGLTFAMPIRVITTSHPRFGSMSGVVVHRKHYTMPVFKWHGVVLNNDSGLCLDADDCHVCLEEVESLYQSGLCCGVGHGHYTY